MKKPLRAPTTRSGWAAYYDLRAQGGNAQACTLSTWYLLLKAAFGE